METTFLSERVANEIRSAYGSPVYVYDEKILLTQATSALQFPSNDGLTVRYAMKACPNAAILQIFDRAGLSFDASSGYEVMRALAANISPHKISLSSQEFPTNFQELYPLGIEFNACSLYQLEQFGKLFPGASCGVRFNPGLGSGGTEKTNVGGPASSFGVWHELSPEVQRIADTYGLQLKKIHTHIGSGSDPAVWQRAAGTVVFCQSSEKMSSPFPCAC
jgi:diaminopimelate decarboxylase